MNVYPLNTGGALNLSWKETEMYCYQQTAENYQSKSSSNHWMNLQDLYLLNHQSSEYLKRYKSLSKIDKYRMELVSFMEQHQKAGRTLFHLTLTYKPFSDRNYQEKDVNKFFRTFYLQYFLPYLLQTKHFNRTYWRQFQPICLAFVDGLEQEGNQQTLRVKKSTEPHWRQYPSTCLKFVNGLEQDGSQKTLRIEKSTELKFPTQLPAPLHHHAILAVHEQNLSNLMQLVGENTFANSGFSYKIMTSDLKQCDATRLLYSSKRMKRFPEFMSFPDRMKWRAQRVFSKRQRSWINW